jgi:quinol monooxygenase YgiN
MIIVVAEIETADGKRNAFLDEFRRLVPQVLAEVGCIEYGPSVDAITDIAKQAPLRENVVTIVEKWESLDILKTHLTASHMMEYREKVKDLVTGSTLRILDPS